MTDVTIRGIDDGVYSLFSAEARRRSVPIGELVTQVMRIFLEETSEKQYTIEGLDEDDPVIQAFAEQHAPGHGTALQCGFCTPGFVMATHGFLRQNPNPTLEEVKEGLSGNLCRCGCYAGIAQAVLRAAEKLRERSFA